MHDRGDIVASAVQLTAVCLTGVKATSHCVLLETVGNDAIVVDQYLPRQTDDAFRKRNDLTKGVLDKPCARCRPCDISLLVRLLSGRLCRADAPLLNRLGKCSMRVLVPANHAFCSLAVDSGRTKQRRISHRARRDLVVNPWRSLHCVHFTPRPSCRSSH